MSEIGVLEAKNKPGQLLDRVAHGEEIRHYAARKSRGQAGSRRNWVQP